jgi:Cu2+-exporting ATPase
MVIRYQPEPGVEGQVLQHLSVRMQQLSRDGSAGLEVGSGTTLITRPAGSPARPPVLAERPSLASTVLVKETWSSLRLPGLAAGLAILSQFARLSKLRPLALAALLAATLPVAQRAFHSLFQQRRLNIDCLDFLALSLSAWQGKLVTPAMVIVLHELGDVIREQTARATEVRTADLMDAIGRFAWVQYAVDQPPQQIPSDCVQVGDIVIVYPGEQIPVDGTVLQGEAVIDQQGLTGESLPVLRREGDAVLASTLVRSGQLRLRADRVGSQTRAAVSIELLQKAPVHDTRMANYAEKVADRLIWPSLLLATVVLLATRDPARAAAILTLDFVTGIRVSMPTAFLGALNHTTRHGILVRSGRTLEQLAEVDTLVFDKTGTLTEGAIAISAIKPLVEGITEDQLLQLAAAAEQRLTHPVAEAVVHCAEQRGLAIPPRGKWAYEVGLGVQAEINGQEVWVGSERFLQQLGLDMNAIANSGNGLDCELENDSRSLIYVACDRQLQGVLQYTDPLRAESDRLLQTLQDLYNVDIYLLTGDSQQRARQVAQQLGIPSGQVFAQAFPDEKARIVRNLHRAGRTVAFVGDGLNDSVALAYADVSVSFAHGSDIARETADVVLMNNDLLDLLEVLSIARQTRNLIDQNIALVVAPNLVALGLASTSGLNPLIATAIHNGSAIAAGVNSLRPLVEHQIAEGKTA